MMSRFTEKAQEALQRAQQVMFTKKHVQLDVEHIFLALLQQRNSIVASIITRLGGDPAAMMRRLEGALNDMQSWAASRTTTGYITLRCNRVLQGAAEEADRLTDDFISTEHMFLSIANERGGATAAILQEANIDSEKIYGVLRMMERERPRERPRPSPSYTSWEPVRPIIDIVTPASLVKPTGYSHGIQTFGGSLLFLAGQIATDGDGKLVAPGDVVGQYRQTLSNLKAVVEEAGGKLKDIVKMTIYVRDRDDYKGHLKELGSVHKEFFGTYYPATTLVEVSRFFEDGVLVEIEGIAVLGEKLDD